MRKKIALLMLIALICTCVFCFFACEDPEKTSGTLDEISVTKIEEVLSAPREDIHEKLSEQHATFLNSSKGLTSLISRSDLVLPERLTNPENNQRLGLMIYDGTKYVPCDTEGVFDENKPTLFFSHGMGYNANWFDTPGYYEEGYNVLSFYWGAFAGEPSTPGGLANVCDKVWIYDGSDRYITEYKGTWYDDEEINFSVVEIYAAYYLDFLRAHPNYKSKQITIAGHSYGGMLCTGLLSYLTTAFRSGILPTYMLPDQVVLCDPFFYGGSSVRHIRWLSDMNNPTLGGIGYLAYETINMAKNLGISVSLFRSGSFIYMLFPMSFDGDMTFGMEVLDLLFGSTLFVDGIADSLFNGDLSASHNFGCFWPANNHYEVMDPSNPDEYAFSAFNPYYENYARMGDRYVAEYNDTQYYYEDDEIVLDYCGKTKLYGFVYLDENGNNKMDERLSSHIVGATVTVKNSSGETVYEGVTELSGYYEFYAEPDTYTVSVSLPRGYALSTEDTSVSVEDGDYFVNKLISAIKE